MSNYKTLVCTTAGNSLLNEDSGTYKRISGNAYTLQKAKNLKKGDMILFHKEYVDKTLDEVEEYLIREDPRYVYAKNMIFERNRNREYVTRLRTNLWRGATAQIRSRYPNLEQRALNESPHFEQQDYRNMNRIIQIELEMDNQNGGPQPVVPSASMNWLVDTMAPDDWNMFRALAQINPYFENFYNDFRRNDGNLDDTNNLYNAYKLLVGIRRGVMRYIASPKGRGGNSHGSSHRTGLKLTPEIDIILRYVLDEVDDERIAAVVTDIKRIEYQPGRGHDTQGIKLSSGIVTEIERPSNIHVKNLIEIAAEENIILGALNNALEEYLPKRFKEEEVYDGKEHGYVMMEINKRLTELSGYNKARPSSSKEQINLLKKHFESFGTVDESRKKYLDSITTKLFEEIVAGPSLVSDYDKRFVIPRGHKFRSERLARYPKEWHEYNDLYILFDDNKVSENKRKEVKKRLNLLREILIKDYRTDPKLESPKASKTTAIHVVRLNLLRKYGFIPDLSPSDFEFELNRFLKNRNIKLFTPEEEAEVIRQYGFEDLLDLSWI